MNSILYVFSIGQLVNLCTVSWLAYRDYAHSALAYWGRFVPALLI